MLYILLWYMFSAGYNIFFKRSFADFPFPWASALFQMALGIPIFGAQWLLRLRKTPRLTAAEAGRLLPAAAANLLTQIGAVIAFCGSAVSFVHIVKASEPVASSVLNYLFVGEVLSWPVYAALVPIIGGVALASVKELSFTWFSFACAMSSNIGSALRSVYSKKVQRSYSMGESMNQENLYSVLTIMSVVMLLPIAIYMEPVSTIVQGLGAAHAVGGRAFWLNMLASGICFYFYNELAFTVLGRMDPVSHAVANTMKRVFVIIVAILVLRNPVTPLGAVGSLVALAGTLAYARASARRKA